MASVEVKLEACGRRGGLIVRRTPDRAIRVRATGGGGYSHTLPIRVCAAKRGRDFEAPGLERGIHFRGVF